MKRVFSYHGAEHKTIRCYEAQLPLTVENVRRMTRLHPRCGTSFLFVVVQLFRFCSSAVSADSRSATCLRMGLSGLRCCRSIVAISYEFNRFVGRHDNWLTRVAVRARYVVPALYDQRAGRLYAGGRHRGAEAGDSGARGRRGQMVKKYGDSIFETRAGRFSRRKGRMRRMATRELLAIRVREVRGRAAIRFGSSMQRSRSKRS